MNRISVLVVAGALGAVALTAGCSSTASKNAAGGGSTVGTTSSAGTASSPGSGANPAGGSDQASASTTAGSSTASSSATAAPPPTSSSPATHAAGTACTTAQMPAGTWRVVPDSQGAGHVAADLTLQNTSTHSCTVAGFPAIALLASNDRTLPSYIVKDTSAAVTTITVAPGAFVHAEMRYSANVPGPGEPQSGQCEPTTVHAQAQLPGDTAWAHITLDSPTPVCEKGELEMKPFVSGQSSPAGG